LSKPDHPIVDELEDHWNYNDVWYFNDVSAEKIWNHSIHFRIFLFEKDESLHGESYGDWHHPLHKEVHTYKE
jgi:hypothetical protein